MLRGFRWQLAALFVAVVLFLISLSARPDANTIAVSATPPPTELNPSVAATDTSQPVVETLIPTMTEDTSVVSIPDDFVTYREALTGNIQRLNPVLAGLNPVDQDVTSLIFEGLTRINQYGEPLPNLAQEWVVSFDGLEYVVTLRSDILWQDGIPFNADDVIYTMSILGSPDFPGPAALGAFWQTIEVEKLGEHLVRFRLPQPLASFPEALRVGLLPFHALQGTTASQIATHPFNLTPIGTGPYQLEKIQSTDGRITSVDLRVAPVYRQRPEGQSGFSIERIRFRFYDSFETIVQALRSGEVDGYAAQSRSERLNLLPLEGDITLHTAHDPSVGLLIFNWADENFGVFREQRVRLALEMALNRDSIIQRQLLNTAVRADSPILRNSWAYDGALEWLPFNLQGAKDLLATANISARITPEETAEATSEITPVDSDALFTFSILTPDDPALIGVAQEIAAQWSLLNVVVQVEAVNLETYRERLTSSQFDAALVELSNEGSADPDVYSFWHQGQYPDGQNYGGVNDRTISEALERGRRDQNGTNRAVHYRTFQEEFVTRAIAIPLYYPLYTYAVTSRLSGVQLGLIASPPDRFLTIKDWTFAQ